MTALELSVELVLLCDGDDICTLCIYNESPAVFQLSQICRIFVLTSYEDYYLIPQGIRGHLSGKSRGNQVTKQCIL